MSPVLVVEITDDFGLRIETGTERLIVVHNLLVYSTIQYTVNRSGKYMI